MQILQKKDVIYVVTYDDRTSIKKIRFQNGISLDLFPDVQGLLYTYRQVANNAPEAGGILIGYENTSTGNFTVSGATVPQASDIRSRITLFLGKQHRELLKKMDPPYGCIGTWHTHPSSVPDPSSVDLRDWKKCIKIVILPVRWYSLLLVQNHIESGFTIQTPATLSKGRYYERSREKAKNESSENI